MIIKTSEQIAEVLIDEVPKEIEKEKWVSYKDVLDLPRTLLFDVLEEMDLAHRTKFIIQGEFYKRLRNKLMEEK